jgi:hypothetical protein
LFVVDTCALLFGGCTLVACEAVPRGAAYTNVIQVANSTIIHVYIAELELNRRQAVIKPLKPKPASKSHFYGVL